MKFLVIAPQGLGDALEATPVVKALKMSAGHPTVDVVVLRSGPRELFSALDEYVDRVIHLPFWEVGPRGFTIELLRSAAFRRYEASFLMYPSGRREYHVLGALLGAKRRYAHRYFDTSLTNMLWLETKLVDISSEHNVFRNLDLLAAAGIKARRPTGYVVPSAWRRDGEREPDRIAVHVGTTTHDGLDRRRWSSESFVGLVERFRARGLNVWLISGPSEREVTKEVAEASHADGIVEGSLPEIARFLSTCGGVVSNDSGIAHLAAGVGTAVLAVFGPTPVQHGPFGDRALAFRPSPCPPCFDPRLLNTDCARNIDYACLHRDTTVPQVEARFLSLIEAETLSPPKSLTDAP